MVFRGVFHRAQQDRGHITKAIIAIRNSLQNAQQVRQRFLKTRIVDSAVKSANLLFDEMPI